MNNSGVRSVLYRWFVQFNPFFTASALCVLGGVLLLSRALGVGSERVLAVVVELYQWLLIGVAGVLYRRLLERRPATILGLIAVVFAMDPTLQMTALATTGSVLGVTLWLLSFAAKVRGLVWAFRLKVADAVCALPVLGAGIVAALPLARLADVDDDVLRGGLAAGAFGIAALVDRLRPSLASAQALDDATAAMFVRIQKAVAAIAVGGAALQIVNATLMIGPTTVFMALSGCLLALALQRTDEREVGGLVVAGVVAALFGGSAPAALPLVAVVLIAAARHSPVIAAVAVVALRAGLTFALPTHVDGAVGLTLDVAAGAALVAIAVRRRLPWAAIPAVVLNMGWAGPLTARSLRFCVDVAVSTSSQSWGTTLVLAGFALVPVGVVLHRRLSRALADVARAQEADGEGGDDGEPPNGDGCSVGPSTSAQLFSSTALPGVSRVSGTSALA
jgi:uncharacterized membrane protein